MRVRARMNHYLLAKTEPCKRVLIVLSWPRPIPGPTGVVIEWTSPLVCIPRKRVCRSLIVQQMQRTEIGSTLSNGVNECKILFSLPFCKYCSKLQTVNEKKLCIGLKKPVGVILFCSNIPKIWGNGGTPFLLSTPMHLALPTSGLDLPCAVCEIGIFFHWPGGQWTLII